MVVRLSTETQRLPIYAAGFYVTDGCFSDEYASTLQKILQFDLNYNGMTYVLDVSEDFEKLISGDQIDRAPKTNDWKALEAFYLVKGAIKDKKLIVRLYAANGESVKGVDGLLLSGDLAKDRKQIHILADTIFKTLFGKEGIATSKILYTVKTTQGGKTRTEVVESDYDGENRRKVLSEPNLIVSPVYVPPKEGFATGSFLYVSYQTGQPKSISNRFRKMGPRSA